MDWDDHVRDEQHRGPTPDFAMSPWMGRHITEAEARAQVGAGATYPPLTSAKRRVEAEACGADGWRGFIEMIQALH